VKYTDAPKDELYRICAAPLQQLGVSVLEWFFSVKGTQVHIQLTICAKGSVGVQDCSRVHRLIQARAELLYKDSDIHVEVSSPGIDRNLKDAREFGLLQGRGVRCYRTDISDWTAGRVVSADDTKVSIENKLGIADIPFGIIAKAKLDYSQEVED
jgi:ribosome maturation factor RimP